MGNCSAGKDYKKDGKTNPDGTRAGAYKKKGTNNIPMGDAAKPGTNTSFNPMKYDYVIANAGKVDKEYELISPPLGAGAFGEVRKAIHRASGLERAVKIIYKDKSDPVELAKIIDEVIFNVSTTRISLFDFWILKRLIELGQNLEQA